MLTQNFTLPATFQAPQITPNAAPTRPTTARAGIAWDDTRLEAFLDANSIAHKSAEAWNGGTKWQLAECPFCKNTDHNAIVTNMAGVLGFTCQHNSCKGTRHWADFRAYFEGQRPARPNAAQAQAMPAKQVSQSAAIDDIGEATDSYPLTDVGNAERLAADWGNVFRHAEGRGWLTYNPTRNTWEATAAEKRVYSAAVSTVRKLYALASRIDEQELRKKVAGFARRCESNNAIKAMMTAAAHLPALHADQSEFDSDDFLLNTLSGPVDLRTGELLPADSAQMFTRCCNASYAPAAPAPLWLGHLNLVFAGNKALIEYMQIVAGISLTGSTDGHSFYILHGGGRNGKSKLAETLAWVMGDYALSMEVENLTDKRGDVTALAQLVGRRMVLASESSDNQKLHTGRIKRLTGGGKWWAKRLYHDAFEFAPQFKLWLDCNTPPQVEADYAMAERVKKIPFLVTIPEAQRIADFGDRLKAEADGILAWAVEGAVKWYKAGKRVSTPPEVKEATEAFMAEQDTFAAWLEECCTTSPRAFTASRALFDSYTAFTGANMTLNQFSRLMTKRGYTPGKDSKAQRGYKGIGLLA